MKHYLASTSFLFFLCPLLTDLNLVRLLLPSRDAEGPDDMLVGDARKWLEEELVGNSVGGPGRIGMYLRTKNKFLIHQNLLKNILLTKTALKGFGKICWNPFSPNKT